MDMKYLLARAIKIAKGGCICDACDKGSAAEDYKRAQRERIERALLKLKGK